MPRTRKAEVRQDLVDTTVGIPWARVGAYVIDWALSGILTGLPEVVIFNLVSGTHDLFSDLYAFGALGLPAAWAYLCAALSLVLFLCYYLWIPLRVYPGQTPGKRICHLKIARMDEGGLDARTLFLREVVGLLLIESSATIMGPYLRQALTLATGVYLEGILAWIGAVLFMVSSIMVFALRGQRAIHDHIAGTRVVGTA